VSSSVTRYVLVVSGFLGGFLAVSGSLLLIAPPTGLCLWEVGYPDGFGQT